VIPFNERNACHTRTAEERNALPDNAFNTDDPRGSVFSRYLVLQGSGGPPCPR